MKKSILSVAVASVFLLAGCGDDTPKTPDQVAHSQKMEELKLKMQHEERMAQIQAQASSGTMTPPVQPVIVNAPDHVYQQEQPIYEQRPIQYQTQSYPSGTYSSSDGGEQSVSYNDPVHQPDSGISVAGAVGIAAAGALAGYAASELLDNGMRSYTGSDGRTVYVGKDGKEISKTDYENYRKQNPIKSKISDRNAQAKQVINKGATKTVEASKKGYNYAKQTSQKAASATKSAASKATSTIRSKTSSSTRSSSFRSGTSRRK